MSRAVGLDIGSRDDFTSFAVLDTVQAAPSTEADAPRRKPEVHAVWLERWRHIPYPAVIEKVATLYAQPALHGVPLVVDATGVGRAVADLLRERISTVEAVVFTAGFEASSPSPHEHRVPKRDLVAALDVLVSTHRLKVAPSLPAAGDFLRELGNFGYSITASGHDTYNANTGHDDLVTSVALAAWWLAQHPSQGEAFLEAWRRRGGVAAVPVLSARGSWRDRVQARGGALDPPLFRPPPSPGAA